MKQYYVYILASKPHGTLYVGFTSNLEKRIWQHKLGIVDGFIKKHSIKILVYVETFCDVHEAIHREKCIKRWKRG